MSEWNKMRKQNKKLECMALLIMAICFFVGGWCDWSVLVKGNVLIVVKDIDSFSLTILFFSNKKYGKEYDNYYTDHINKLCVQVWPNFQKVIESQVEPIDDPERPGYQINAEEWMKAPTIGHFSVYEHGDPIYGTNYEPPAGARIIRTNTDEE